MHGAQFKAKVLSECRKPGASVAAVAQAFGLNANLVRKWMTGRGMKRCGLGLNDDADKTGRGAAQRTAALQFVPVELAMPGSHPEPDAACATPTSADAAHIHVELCRGGTGLSVRWPASQAGHCAAWLRELAGGVLK